MERVFTRLCCYNGLGIPSDLHQGGWLQHEIKKFVPREGLYVLLKFPPTSRRTIVCTEMVNN